MANYNLPDRIDGEYDEEYVDFLHSITREEFGLAEEFDDDVPFALDADNVTPWERLMGEKKAQTRRLTVFRDHHLKYEELWLSCHIITDFSSEEAQFAEWLTRAKCYQAKDIDDADIVFFTGGDDVDPGLYGEKPHRTTRYNRARDEKETDLYLYCLERGIPMVGICRGMQFLHIMNGGKMWQNVDNHQQEHSLWDVRGKRNLEGVSSVHHQMCRENSRGGMTLLATGNTSRKRESFDSYNEGPNADVEALFYRDTCCLGIQGHPEYRGYNAFSVWSLELINHWINENPDCESKNGRLRVKEELLKERYSAKMPQVMEGTA